MISIKLQSNLTNTQVSEKHTPSNPDSANRSSSPEVLVGRSVLKIWRKLTGEYPWRSVISINLLCNFIEVTLQHGCSPVNFLHHFVESSLLGMWFSETWVLLSIISKWHVATSCSLQLLYHLILLKHFFQYISPGFYVGDSFATLQFMVFLQNKHKTSAFFKKNLVPANKDETLNKSAFGSDESNHSLAINSVKNL